ncbi:MAG: DNA-directed polymerase alpha subunit [Actinomycetota bacterium]|jgi:DNA-directed RNA polymerase subunit alpha
MLVIQRPSVSAISEAVGNRQKFSVSPLEPGLGHTIGNSLRRMLLSTIPGAAITSVKFDKALHEFTTIDGVTEDITEIILNLKDVVVKSEVDEVVTVRIDVNGPKDVTAADIQLPAGVEFINSSQHIATLSAKGSLSLEITIERGKGYVGSDRDSGRKTIGVIPVDALFSPVRRVSFEVEPTRVAQSTNYDNLILDVETDGSITPAEAVASAGATLRNLLELVASLSDEPIAIELGESTVSGSGSPELDMPIEDLLLSQRPHNCLKRAQVNTIGELVAHSEEELMGLPNFGAQSINEVKAKLDERGLALRV